MPSFGSLFSAIGRLLPGFVEGERLAIRDNWNDLNQYNQVQQGQMDNAFQFATFEPRLNNVWYQSAVNELNARRHGMDYAEYAAGHQGRLDREATMGANLGPLTAQQIGALQAQLARMARGASGYGLALPGMNSGGAPTGLDDIDPNTGLPRAQLGTNRPSGI